MPCNLDSWFALSTPARLLWWLAATLCGLALLWWQVVSPQQKALTQAGLEQAMRQQTRAEQWRKLRALEPPADAAISAPEERCFFSPLSLPAPGQQLVRWQPEPGGGEAELETPWQAAVDLFQRLASCDMQIASFALTSGDGALRFTLHLEHGNGD